MTSLEPMINLLMFLTALSVAAERLTNWWKLRKNELRVARMTEQAEKEREQAITGVAIASGVLLALLLKADLIVALHRIDAPWETLGWIQMQGSNVLLVPEARSVTAFISALFGCVVTGFALGFGSKFWHELLDAVLELRNMAKLRNERTQMKLSDQWATPAASAEAPSAEA